jgi:DNA-binding MarR family transcriptional regulator
MATEPAFDAIIHAPMRLRLCGLLRRVNEAEFSVLRDTLSISDATLSKHLKVLFDAGYVSTRKSRSPDRGDARRLTWLHLTSSGRRAFDGHVAELRRISDGFTDGATGSQAADAPSRSA